MALLTPPTIAATYFWVADPAYCFSDSAGTVACNSGDLVYVWKDTTGTYAFTQATSGLRPTFTAVSPGWCVRNNGSSTYMAANAALIAYLSSPAGLSWAYLLNLHGLTASSGVSMFMRAQQANTSSNAALWGGFFQSGLTAHARTSAGSIVATTTLCGRPTIYNASAWNPSTGAMISDWNGNLSSLTGANTTPGTMTALTVGGDPTGGSYSQSDFYTLALSNTTWTTPNLATIAAYFNTYPVLQAAQSVPFVPTPVAVFTGGVGGYNTYRIPAICNYNGTLIAVAEGRTSAADTGAKIDLACSLSTNGGATWSTPSAAVTNGSNIADNPVLIADPTRGKVHLIYCQQLASDPYSGVGATTRTEWYTYSTNAGSTWQTPVQITSMVMDTTNMQWYATTGGNGLLLPSGRLVVACTHSEVSYGGTEYKSHVIYSDDGGTTWTRAAAPGPVNGNESTVAALANGTTLILNSRNAGTTDRIVAVSTDSGTTWGTVGAYDVRLNQTGTEGASIFSNGLYYLSTVPDGAVRQSVSLMASPDGSSAWTKSTVIDPGFTAYSSLCDLGGGTLGMLYEWGASAGAYSGIKFVPLCTTTRLRRTHNNRSGSRGAA